MMCQVLYIVIRKITPAMVSVEMVSAKSLVTTRLLVIVDNGWASLDQVNFRG